MRCDTITQNFATFRMIACLENLEKSREFKERTVSKLSHGKGKL